ncbi:MAG: hypothetical protein AAGN64_04040 [Bacteroidota bacterium]
MELIASLLALAERQPFGFTVRLPDLTPVREGFAVAYAATQNSHTPEQIERCVSHALANDGVIGGWRDTDTDTWYWDSVRIYADRAEAEAAGRREAQIGVYDLGNDEYIPL